MAETANDVQEALNKARQMCETGLANVSIEDEAGSNRCLLSAERCANKSTSCIAAS
jgi:2-methylisocitrate lyase-like PEP mutase family enzyme